MNKADQNTNYLSHNEPIPLVRVKGSHRQIGQQIGETFRPQIQHSLQNACRLIDSSYNILELTWEGAKIQSKKYMPFAQELFPQYIEEMIGIAEGAAVDFDDIAILNVMEAVTSDALHLTKCTSFAVNGEMTSDGHVLVAHNEDWLPEDEDAVYLVHAEPDDEPPFLSMAYGGLIPNIGFNAYGIAQCCDSVYPNDSRIGVPRVVVSRAVLARKTLGDSIRTALTPRRAAGYNHLIAHESGELYNVEVSSRNFSIRYADENYIAHTNHYLSQNMMNVESDSDELINTRVRYFRALRLLKSTSMHNIRTLQDIQRDHTNHPNSICNHADTEIDPLDREKTINAMVIDLTARVMHISWGNPCQNKYHTYYLDA